MEASMDAGKKNRLSVKAVALLLLALAVAPREARAMTFDGTLMTNMASVTFSGLGGLGTMYKSTYLASANVLICNPMVVYVKTATPSMVAPTATVTFSVCTLNNSITTSAFSVVITDQIPGNMGWTSVVAVGTYVLPATSTITPTYAALLTGPWTAGNPLVGQVNSYLRWAVSMIGIGKSACVSYTASVL